MEIGRRTAPVLIRRQGAHGLWDEGLEAVRQGWTLSGALKRFGFGDGSWPWRFCAREEGCLGLSGLRCCSARLLWNRVWRAVTAATVEDPCDSQTKGEAAHDTQGQSGFPGHEKISTFLP